MWVSCNLFHIAWQGNYELWVKNPIKTTPIAHGIYNWLYTVGFNSLLEIYNFVIMNELLAVAVILLAELYLVYLDAKLYWLGFVKPSLLIWVLRMFVSYFDLGNLRLNYHIGVLIINNMRTSGHNCAIH